MLSRLPFFRLSLSLLFFFIYYWLVLFFLPFISTWLYTRITKTVNASYRVSLNNNHLSNTLSFSRCLFWTPPLVFQRHTHSPTSLTHSLYNLSTIRFICGYVPALPSSASGCHHQCCPWILIPATTPCRSTVSPSDSTPSKCTHTSTHTHSTCRLSTSPATSSTPRTVAKCQ